VSVAPFWVITWVLDAQRSPRTGGVVSIAFNQSVTDSGSNAPQMTRLIRIVRLLKFSRLLKASGVLKRIETKMSVSYAQVTIPKLTIGTILWSHYTACIWGLLPQLEFGEEYTWLDALRDDKLGACANFPKTCMEPLSPFDKYAAAFYHATMTVTGIGYGEMCPVNTTERYVSSVLMLLSGFLWCYVTGLAVSVISSMNPEAITFRSRLDSLDHMMRVRHLPEQLQVELRDFFHKTRVMQRMESEKPILQMLSPGLQGRVAVVSNRIWLECCWYLRPDYEYYLGSPTQHASFISDLSSQLTLHGFVPQERLMIGMMFIVRVGLVIQRWRLHCSGRVVGQDMIIDDPRLLDHSEAVSLSYAETFRLTRGCLEMVCRQHPSIDVAIEKASRRLRIQRKLILFMRRKSHLPIKSFSMASSEEIKRRKLEDVDIGYKMDIILDCLPGAQQKMGGGKTYESFQSPSETARRERGFWNMLEDEGLAA